jgi:hypothetical protein
LIAATRSLNPDFLIHPGTEIGRGSELNQVFDNRIEQLNAAYEKAKAELRKMRLMGHCRVVYDRWLNDDQNPSFSCFSYIGIVKLDGQWRMCHGYGDESDETIAWKPIRDASIQERISVVRSLRGATRSGRKSERESGVLTRFCNCVWCGIRREIAAKPIAAPKWNGRGCKAIANKLRYTNAIRHGNVGMKTTYSNLL